MTVQEMIKELKKIGNRESNIVVYDGEEDFWTKPIILVEKNRVIIIPEEQTNESEGIN